MCKKILLLIMVFGAMVFSSCEDEPVCTEMATAYLQAGFYKAIEGEEQDSVLDNLSVYGLGADEPWIKNDSNVKQIRLPLNFDHHSSVFILNNDSVTDTLYFVYNTILNFVSYECGFAPNYEISKASSSKLGIDSVVVVKSLVETEDEENLKIYF